MPDFRQTRSTVARWKKLLIPTYNELIRVGAGDVWVYGSQAMSLYMKRPFASKDLDLLASGMTIDIVKRLCDSLAVLSNQKKPYYQLLDFEHEGKSNPIFSIYLTAQNEKPFAIELFQTYNGNPVREPTPYAAYVKRWKNEFQTLTIEAIIATRLGFRPPDRITPFNAERLNLFIRTMRDQIDWRKVEEFAKKFQLEAKIAENLKALKRLGIEITDYRRLSFLS